MICNIGKKNRASRMAGGIILIALSVYYFGTNQYIAAAGMIIGLVIILEGVFGYCLLHGLRRTRDMR